MGYLKWGGLVVLFILWGCGGNGGSSGATGMLKVSITDAPVCGFDQVNVTVSKVRVHQSGNAGEGDAGWTDLNLTPGPKKINLAALTNGVLEELGEAALPVGHYTQLRLVLVPNSPAEPLNNSVVINNVETALDTPSGVQSGIKLIHQFDVEEDTLVDLVLDFDACKSIVTKGNGGYALKPVITVIPQVVSGAIAGSVVPATGPASLLNPVVYAQQGGRVVKSTIPDANGAFVLSPLQQRGMEEGYTVVIVADNAATVIIASVPVTAQQTTPISDSTDPIEMAPSAANTVEGTISPSSAEATVRAIQSVFISPPCAFENSPCASPAVQTPIEIRSTTVTESYTLTLPVAAPWLGSYAAGLPIALTEQGSGAGEYTLEASAEGFQTQPASVNLSGGNVPHDFTLTPE